MLDEDTGDLDDGPRQVVALRDLNRVSGRATLLQNLFLWNSRRVLRRCGHQIAPWTDDVAKVSIINSVFFILWEENEVKSGPL